MKSTAHSFSILQIRKIGQYIHHSSALIHWFSFCKVHFMLLFHLCLILPKSPFSNDFRVIILFILPPSPSCLSFFCLQYYQKVVHHRIEEYLGLISFGASDALLCSHAPVPHRLFPSPAAVLLSVGLGRQPHGRRGSGSLCVHLTLRCSNTWKLE
jgi:hypothetical protein